jgi:glycine/D-amino acid oxidase-like deaminating enzyme
VHGGHGANGLLLGPYRARLGAEVITGRPPATDITPLRVERFGADPEGGWPGA